MIFFCLTLDTLFHTSLISLIFLFIIYSEKKNVQVNYY